jgi:hypothetical protein
VRLAWPGRIELKVDPEVERVAAVLNCGMDDYLFKKY